MYSQRCIIAGSVVACSACDLIRMGDRGKCLPAVHPERYFWPSSCTAYILRTQRPGYYSPKNILSPV